MPWSLYAVGLLAAFLLQTAVLPLLPLDAVDLLLTLALICGLAAPVPEARLAGWGAGFVKDLDTDGPLGLHAVLCGLAVLLLTVVRAQLNLQLWWVRWLLATAVAWPVELAARLHQALTLGTSASVGGLVLGSLLTAVVAGLLAALLLALPGRAPRRRASHRRW